MQNTGWRTVVIENPMRLSLSDHNMVLSSEETGDLTVPIEQIRDLLVAFPGVSISAALISELASSHVNMILCDNKHMPCCELNGINIHSDSAGCLMDQVEWHQEQKDIVWKLIVQDKIRMQMALLKRLNLTIPEPIPRYLETVQNGDSDNREGVAARVYFPALFGSGFIRQLPDSINASLNYGYAILSSAMTRILAVHGYNAALGIHHMQRANKINLSCDLMEPFRPFVDEVAYSIRDKELNSETKHLMIELQQARCSYNGQHMMIQTAMELYALDVLKSLKDGQHKIGVIDFV